MDSVRVTMLLMMIVLQTIPGFILYNQSKKELAMALLLITDWISPTSKHRIICSTEPLETVLAVSHWCS